MTSEAVWTIIELENSKIRYRYHRNEYGGDVYAIELISGIWPSEIALIGVMPHCHFGGRVLYGNTNYKIVKIYND
jgi:hypothetical protein